MGVERIKDLGMFQFGCVVMLSRGRIGSNSSDVVVSIAHHSLGMTREWYCNYALQKS